MWELDCKESWVLKNWCFWTVVLEKTLESPLNNQETQPSSPKGNQPWLFTGRTDAEAPILWPPDVKSWLFRKDPDAGKDWRQEEKGTTEHEMLDGISSSMDVSLSKPQEWWWTGKPDMLQSIVKHERVTEVNWTEYYSVGFSDEQTVKNLPAMQETQFQPLGQENPLEKEWLPCILPLRIPWTGKPGRLQSMGLQSHTLSN